MPSWHDAAGIEDVRDEVPLGITAGGLAVVLFRLGAEVFALHDRCSHGGVKLSDGFVENGCVECPLHQGLVDIRSGAPRSAPITKPVRSVPVRVVGERIEVEV